MSPSSPANNRAWTLAGALLGLVIAGYALFVATPYLSGPSLQVLSPLPYAELATPSVVIAGTTARVSYLSINDQPVPLAEDGTFTAERSFPMGYTVVVVRAKDRFGREVEKTISIVQSYKPAAHGIQTQEVSIKGD